MELSAIQRDFRFIDDRRQSASRAVCLKLNLYRNLTPHLSLVTDDELCEPWCVCTTNLGVSDGCDEIDDCVFIRDDAEHAGMAELLARNGVIEPDPVAMARSGFVDLHAYPLSAPVREAYRALRTQAEEEIRTENSRRPQP